MADTALGELRRAARPIEQRIERIARWRAQGLDSGESDATFPADSTDGAVFSGGSDSAAPAEGSAATPRWLFDEFDLTSSTTNSFALTAYPIENSEIVRVNGLVLEPSEYVIAGSTLTLDDIAAVRLGIGADTWRLVASYAYFDRATSTATTALAFGGPENAGTVTLPEAPTSGTVAVLVTSGEVTGVSGAFTTWTKLYDDATGMDGASTEISLWVGTEPSSGTTVTFTGTYTFGMYCAGVMVDNIAGSVTLRNSAIANYHDILGLNSTPTVTAVAGDIVVAATLNKPDFLSERYPSTPDSWSETGYAGVRAAYAGSAVNRGTGVSVGIASATTVGAEFFIDGNATGYTQFGMFAINAGGAAPDPAIAVPGGSYVPPAPPATPGTPLLSWEPPDTTGYTAQAIAAGGGTYTLDDDVDYVLSAAAEITAPVKIVGGRNIVWIGGVFGGRTSVPSGSYDSTHRGIRISDGANPNLKRVIFLEGLLFKSGTYLSDAIQIALRSENATTVILQNIRVAATNYGSQAGVHADALQCWGGPRTLFIDGFTALDCRYQGFYLDAGDGRSLPSGTGHDWDIRRVNLVGGSGARYLLADRRPSFTNLVCDEVYTIGENRDATDSFGNWPATGLTQGAAPSGGDWVPSSLWTGVTYTSPGYV